MWHDLTVAFCLLLVIEGLLPAISPGGWKRVLASLGAVPERHIRQAGLGFMCAGALLLFLIN